MAYYVLFDTETTGNQEEDRVIQFGAMIVDQKGKVEAFDELCSCEIPIKLEAMEVHNITPDLLNGKPKAIETNFYKKLEELNSSENFLIAHNISFDMGMIKKEGFVIYPGSISGKNIFRIGNIGDIKKEDMEKLLKSIEKYTTEVLGWKN